MKSGDSQDIEDLDREIKRAQLIIHEKELRVSRWANPLVIAIAAACIAALGNSLVTYVDAQQNRAM